MKRKLKLESGKIVELKSLDQDEAIKHKVRVVNIESSNGISVEAPIVNGNVLAMHNGRLFELTYYMSSSVYIQKTQVVSRFLSGTVVCAKLELVGEPKRINRRQYFRLPVLIDAFSGAVGDEYKPMTTINLSAGGIRFVSLEKYEDGEPIRIRLTLNEDILDLDGDVISCCLLKDSIRRHDVRVKFSGLTGKEESIILQYLFEEQRLIRRKGLA